MMSANGRKGPHGRDRYARRTREQKGDGNDALRPTTGADDRRADRSDGAPAKERLPDLGLVFRFQPVVPHRIECPCGIGTRPERRKP